MVASFKLRSFQHALVAIAWLLFIAICIPFCHDTARLLRDVIFVTILTRLDL